MERTTGMPSGERTEDPNERDRTLLEDGPGEGRRHLDRDPEAHQRRGRETGEITWTFAKFCEVVYLPVCKRKWKASTDMVETNRLEVHLVRPLGEKLMQDITRSELQALLDETGSELRAEYGRSSPIPAAVRFRARDERGRCGSESRCGALYAAALPGRAEREVLTPDQAATMIGALELREKVIVRLATWEGNASWRDPGAAIGRSG